MSNRIANIMTGNESHGHPYADRDVVNAAVQ